MPKSAFTPGLKRGLNPTLTHGSTVPEDPKNPFGRGNSPSWSAELREFQPSRGSLPRSSSAGLLRLPGRCSRGQSGARGAWTSPGDRERTNPPLPRPFPQVSPYQTPPTLQVSPYQPAAPQRAIKGREVTAVLQVCPRWGGALSSRPKPGTEGEKTPPGWAAGFTETLGMFYSLASIPREQEATGLCWRCPVPRD